MKTANNFINTLFHTFNYFKVWDRRQLNPTYTGKIFSYQHIGLWPQVDNKDILLMVGFNYKLFHYEIVIFSSRYLPNYSHSKQPNDILACIFIFYVVQITKKVNVNLIVH